jgi:hypothetical protein
MNDSRYFTDCKSETLCTLERGKKIPRYFQPFLTFLVMVSWLRVLMKLLLLLFKLLADPPDRLKILKSTAFRLLLGFIIFVGVEVVVVVVFRLGGYS